MAVYIIEITWA